MLLFDEPLSNLDAKLRRHVREEIRELQQSLALTAVYVTHDQQEALAISDRIMVMSMARIAQDGTPRSLYEQPNSHFVADFIGDANIVPVTIEGYQGELASVRLGPLLLTLPHHGAIDGAPELSVRPQALLLAPAAGQSDALIARVSKAAYLGSHMEYWVAVEGVSKELFVISPGCRGTIRPRPRGRRHTCPQWRRLGPATLNGNQRQCAVANRRAGLLEEALAVGPDDVHVVALALLTDTIHSNPPNGQHSGQQDERQPAAFRPLTTS